MVWREIHGVDVFVVVVGRYTTGRMTNQVVRRDGCGKSHEFLVASLIFEITENNNGDSEFPEKIKNN